MKHRDIYEKFMIEYDKANVLSSYPSLTEYEVATFLDKAYNTLIGQKVTGNTVRRFGFETDIKSTEDLAPLIQQEDMILHTTPLSDDSPFFLNMRFVELPKNCLYLLHAFLYKLISDTLPEDSQRGLPLDLPNVDNRTLPVQLVSHQMSLKFRSNSYNKPWIKIPVGYIENERLYIICDEEDINKLMSKNGFNCTISYIKAPNTFVKDLSDLNKFPDGNGVYTYFNPAVSDADNLYYDFECGDTVAEELISLAIAYALENVESARLNIKLNMRGLES